MPIEKSKKKKQLSHSFQVARTAGGARSVKSRIYSEKNSMPSL